MLKKLMALEAALLFCEGYGSEKLQLLMEQLAETLDKELISLKDPDYPAYFNDYLAVQKEALLELAESKKVFGEDYK